MKLQVECCAGGKADKRPIRFQIGDRQRWPPAGHSSSLSEAHNSWMTAYPSTIRQRRYAGRPNSVVWKGSSVSIASGVCVLSPFKEPQDNLVRQEVGDREAVLLDGFDFLAQIQIGCGRGVETSACGRHSFGPCSQGPDRTAVNGFASRLSLPARRIFPIPMA